MHSISSQPIHLLIFTCLLFSSLAPITHAQPPPYSVCYTTYNYTQGSQYESNLNLTLTSLSSNILPIGFYTTYSGTNPDDVYGLLQCRADISNEDCQACAANSTLEITKQCPNRNEAVIFYDECMLHYADYRFFSTLSTNPLYSLYNLQNTSDPVLFNSQLGDLMDNLSSTAPSNSLKFATGRINVSDFVNIYGLVQCTRDLSENYCLRCLQAMIEYIPTCCDGKQGGRVLGCSCYIRYETYSFFKSSPSPPPPPPPVVNSPPPAAVVDDNSTTATTTNSSSSDGKKGNSKTIIIAIVIPTVIASVLTSAMCFCLLWRKFATRSVLGAEEDEAKSMESIVFDLLTLRNATNNFSDSYKLGQGGFGPVYKGKLPDGREIAVKRLSQKSGQGLEELKTEVVLVAKLLHRNLVRLLGFCLEEEEKLLVYEYLPNGSLDKILFDENRRLLLEWDKRYKIIVGIARGLLYLHQDSQIRIIHRDLKASNILLDHDMNPKISDFGLARLFCESQVQGNTNRIAGTYGYMAPEYTKHGHFSTKTDVFSFGVLVLEMVAGRKNSIFRNSVNLLSYAWQQWNDRKALEIVDPTIGTQWPRSEILKCLQAWQQWNARKALEIVDPTVGTQWPRSKILKCLQVGLLCVQQDPSNKPTMFEVLLLLNTYNVTCPVPTQPAYFHKRVRKESDELRDSSSTSESDQLATRISQQSVNDVTISEIDPR